MKKRYSITMTITADDESLMKGQTVDNMVLEALKNAPFQVNTISVGVEESIRCENGKEAFVGDKVKVIGKPERFFYDEKIEVTGTVIEIGWYEDEKYFGFILEDSNRFYLTNCEKIYLIED